MKAQAHEKYAKIYSLDKILDNKIKYIFDLPEQDRFQNRLL